MATQQEELLYFNGIDGSSGQPLFPPATAREIAELALAWHPDPERLEDFRRAARIEPTASPPGIGDAGWGVIFAARTDENAGREIRTALADLLGLRRTQAGDAYREFSGRAGYRPNESPRQFLDRQPGGGDLPYYLLLVGDPEAIPYEFQCELALRHAVGRIHFDFPADYLAYANSVLRAEGSIPDTLQRVAFFAMEQRGDRVSTTTARQLVQPMARPLIDKPPDGWKAQGWVSQAEKADLAQHLGGPDTPRLLFTAGQGIGFPEGHPQQLREQGALLCPGWSPAVHDDSPVPVSPAYYFAASDVPPDANMPALISFHYSSYAAGTPRYSYNYDASMKASPVVAERGAFVAALPKTLLAREAGALAFVGPCDRVWGFPSEEWEPAATVRGLFEEAIRRLMRGYPVGAALEPFKTYHADVALRLAELSSFEQSRRTPDVTTLANYWMVLNDTRNLIVIGDPAVRLPVREKPRGDEEPTEVIGAADEPAAGDPWDLAASPAGGSGDKGLFGLTKADRRRIAAEEAGLSYKTEGLSASVPSEQVPDAGTEEGEADLPAEEPLPEPGEADQPEEGRGGEASGEESRQPPSDGPQTIVQSIQVFDLSRYEPPGSDRKVVFTVSKETAKIESSRGRSSSKLAVDADGLLLSALDPKAYGERLFTTIVNSTASLNGVNDTHTGYIEAMDPREKLTRFELEIDPPDDMLNSYAWEFLRPPKGYGDDQPLAVRERSPFYRLLPYRTRPLRVEAGVLKVLVAICNPPQVGVATNQILGQLTPLEPAAEAKIMRAALERLRDAGLLEFKVLGEPDEKSGQVESVTLEKITQELQRGRYHVLHLLGHGIFTQHRPPDNYYLVVEWDDKERLPFVSAEQFKTVLNAGDLKLVVLAACNSAVTQTGDALLGLGPQLLNHRLPAVIAMQRDMPFDAAQFFTQHFYDDLARSGRVDMAMAATRLAMFQRDAQKLDWGIPVLFLGDSQDQDVGRLFDPNPVSAQTLPPLTPDIRTHGNLGVTQDPAVRSMLQMAQAQAASMGAPQLAQALQQRMAAAIGQAPALAVRQNREMIDLDLGARMAPNGLDAFVANHKSQLKLPRNANLQIAAALSTGKHVILIGPPGTGKTTLANVVCEYAQSLGMAAGVVATTATADWSTFDTIGGYAPSADQTLQFKSGCFLEAIAEAKWLIIDEINRAEIDKAFGELFTVLSGQQVVLPYTIGADRVRILPHDRDGEKKWIPASARPAGCDYVVHPHWRIIGTMNVYDKSSLFSMSLAFMRRFAFVDLDLPADYTGLWTRWLDASQEFSTAPDRPQLEQKLTALLDTSTALMKKRALGPAITKDILGYAAARRGDGGGETMEELLAEALVLYAAPQLDGLDRETIRAIYADLGKLFSVGVAEQRGLLPRIRALYPFISEWD